MNNWTKLLNRECSLAFQVEVPFVNRSLLPKLIGIPINNFWCENITYGVYYKGLELKGLAEAIKVKVINDPNFVNVNISDCYRLGNILLKNSVMTVRHNLINCTNIQLLQRLHNFLEAYRNFLPYLVFPHSIERHFMEIISSSLKEHLVSLKCEQQFDLIYETITTPTIYEIDEQIDLLTVANKVKKEGWNRKNKRLIGQVSIKYNWQPFWTITAKPLTNSYFENAIQAYIDSNTNLVGEIKSVKQGQKNRKRNLVNVLKEIKAPKSLKSYVELLQGYMYLRTYRKNIISKAHYLHLPLIIEIGNRMGIGEDIKFVSYEEMADYLKNGNTLAQSVIKERKEAWAVLSIGGKISVISGKGSVDKTAKKYRIEDIQKQTLRKQVKGQPACLGRATGKVKIVRTIREFEKVKQGDILVSPMTTPDYVPIMKKVVAIVTDEGGVTCHAAIVSREFNIPCIVGTGNATKVFTDGDFIEVNAGLGIAKII